MNYPPPPPPPTTLAYPPLPAPKRINIRQKGQRGEREVVKLLQAVVDRVSQLRGAIAPHIQRNQLQSDDGGEDLAGLPGFAVEVKFQENESVPAWWRQACDQAAQRQAVPILFYRGSGQKWKVKFRAYVNTPKDVDQIEMDLTTSVEDFVEWFANAYAETLR